MNFDVVFLDITANKYYDRTTLEKNSLGGTEASVIRVAEGLANLGLSVAVVESRCDYFEPIMGQHCFFLHKNDIAEITCKHFIQIRGLQNFHLFPRAKQYIWLHDLAEDFLTEFQKDITDNKATVIGVSRWHKKDIQKKLPDAKVTYIYNPVPDNIYIPLEARPNYDKNVIVWLSSPHKGLGHALELFKQIKSQNSKMQFIVFNPGYLNIDVAKLSTQPGIAVYGPTPCRGVWGTLQKCLAVFYPTQWDETFGCIASESNALGVPVATFKRAGLSESISSELQFAGNDDEIVKKILDWSANGRPMVVGKDEFKESNVIMDWVKLLAR